MTNFYKGVSPFSNAALRWTGTDGTTSYGIQDADNSVRWFNISAWWQAEAKLHRVGKPAITYAPHDPREDEWWENGRKLTEVELFAKDCK